jgi:hypothetical protein
MAPPNNVLENIAGDVLADAVAFATTDKTTIETWLTTNGIKLANEGQTLIDNFVNGLNLGIFGNAFKSTIVAGINAELQKLIANGQSEVDVLVDLVLSAAATEAKKLQAA